MHQQLNKLINEAVSMIDEDLTKGSAKKIYFVFLMYVRMYGRWAIALA